MKTLVSKRIKLIAGIMLLCLAGVFSALSSSSTIDLSEYIQRMRNGILSIYKTLPEDRVYLHFDKPMYKPGETIWFSAYLRNGKDFKPSEQSNILHVELINPRGNTMKHIKLIAKNGQANGDFCIGSELPGGIYKVKAYTNWQKNDPNPAFFEKEIQIQAVVLPRLKMKLNFERKAFGVGDKVIAKLELQTNENKPLANYKFRYVAQLAGKQLLSETSSTDATGLQFIEFNLPDNLSTNDGLLNVMIDYEGQNESISRSIPIVLNNVDLHLYPEGGDLINGLKTKVAFKALNEFGKPADIEGIVLDSKGTKVAEFSSFHQGMGAFALEPKADEKYTVKITKPEGITKNYQLPQILKQGYVLNTESLSDSQMKLIIGSTISEKLTIMARVRGTVCYKNDFQVQTGTNSFTVNTSEFPVGVAQFTLFDSKGIERCERLVFVNKHKQLNIKIETNKEKYLPREKVQMTVRVTDERGMPMPAQLSLSVVDDQFLSFVDDKTSTILSHMLVEADIKEKVEEPRFYFDPKEEKADKALDYLLMTSGWRRFTWKQVLSDETPVVQYHGERSVIAGKLYTPNGKPASQVEVSCRPLNLKTKTNKDGYFIFNNIELSSPVTLMAHHQNANLYYRLSDYNANLNLYLEEIYYEDERVDDADAAVLGGGNVKRGNRRVRMRQNVAGKGVRNKDKLEDLMIVEDNVEVEEEMQADVLEIPKDEDQEPNEQKPEKLVDVEENKQLAIAERAVVTGDDLEKAGEIVAPANAAYYRAREFAAPVYAGQQDVEVRTDFRTTIFWKGNIEVDRKGVATVEFYNSDAITSFRATVEGISEDGMLGHAEQTYFTQLPFSMSVKIPVEVATEDMVSIPLTLKNNTGENLRGELEIIAPKSLTAMNNVSGMRRIAAKKAETIYLNYKVSSKTGTGNFKVSFRSRGLSDAFIQPVKTVPKGFPVEIAVSGNDKEKNFSVDIQHLVDGSLNAGFTAYPSVVDDLMSGVESILREPYGCFEQTSSSSYPNVLVLQYLENTEAVDLKTMTRARKLLDKGYKRLVTFETSQKGYEWFGSAPGHEALTAYGLMQFNEIKQVYPGIDQKMIDRTADWLLTRRDGKGGFDRNQRALDSYGRADKEITDAYIVYSLTEAGYKNLDKEIKHQTEIAEKSNDPYLIALITNALYNVGDTKQAEKLMKKLLKLQNKDSDAWIGDKHSITCSTGKSLQVETTSLVTLAIIKSQKPDTKKLNQAVKSIVSSRSGYGGFGSTQATVMALKALTEYSKFSKRTDESGTIEIYVNNRKVAEQSYEAGQTEPIEMKNLEKYLKQGRSDIKIRYKDVKNPLPYSFAIHYNTTLPNSSDSCKVLLNTQIASKRIDAGQTVRLTTELKNKTNDGLPMTLAIVGIPAGLSPQPWQLKELQEKKTVDFYEIKGNRVIFYYRQMQPQEERTIHLDLKADIPGIYEAPASSAYLYYTNEYKHWTSLNQVEIRKK